MKLKFAVASATTVQPRHKTRLALILITTLCATAVYASSGGEGESSNSSNYTTGKINYLPLAPNFVVNIQDNNYLRFMQVGIDLMTMDAEVATAVQKHMAPIRHELLMFLSSRDIDEVFTVQAREKLRQEALAKVQNVLEHYADIPASKKIKGEDGKEHPSSVQEVLFTGFVIQ